MELRMRNESALIARVCHDLITPFNAINLGLEAFEMSRDESLLRSIRESVDKANSVMKFTRELFSDRSETFCYSAFSLKQLVSDFLRFHNSSFELESDMENIASIAGKIIMHMAVVAKEIMPFGGVVSTKIDDELGEIVTKCSGRSISTPEMSFNGEVNHKNIIRYSLMTLLKKSEFKLTIHHEGSDVIFCKKIT